MKYINYLLFLVITLLSACQASTLTDETSNSFTAIATQGKFADKVVISWIQAEFYTSYTVLKSSTKDGAYTPINSSVTGKEIEDKNIEQGTQYFYKVQGYNKLGTPMFITESAIGYAGVVSGISPPSEITIDSPSTKEIEFSWKRVKGVVEYEILKSTDNIFFETIAKTGLLHYKDTSKNLEIEKKYYYKITSLDKDGIPSPNRSQTIIGELFGANLELNSPAGVYTDKIQLIWKPYQYANKYSIYRSTNAGEMGIVIKEIVISDNTVQTGSTLEYNDTDVALKLYYYTIIYENATAFKKTDAVRSYLKTDEAPAQPQNLQVDQGIDTKNVSLSWDTVEGAISYEIARSISENGPWQILKDGIEEITYEDKDVPNDSYTYFYTVTAFNPNPGQVSEIKEGWANKPPINITASQNLGDKVQLSWDRVPGARSYIIHYSETETGQYDVIRSESANNKKRFIFDHEYDIGNELVKDLWYKIEVLTDNNDLSDPSVPVKGIIKKMTAPQNVVVHGHNELTKSMTIAWTEVSGASKYHIYQATLAHKGASANKLALEHFKLLGKSDNRSYSVQFVENGPSGTIPLYPIRRHVFLVKAVNSEGVEGIEARTEEIWRLPMDIVDFMKDVDFTIVEAQTQVKNFGGLGSSGNIKGRYKGTYKYSAKIGDIKSDWYDYTSFEIQITGKPKMELQGLEGSKMNGPINISGLYNGSITYHDLLGVLGGYTRSGTISATYQLPQGGELTANKLSVQEAGGILDSVVIEGKEEPPTKPNFEQGHGL